MGRAPPRPQTFERNELFKFKRGFASKIPAEMAKERYGLDPKGDLVVWLAPDGSRLLTERQASLNNARRRSSLNISDAWRDLKKIAPDRAKEIGWNGFQKLNRGIKGSRVKILQNLQKVGVDLSSLGRLAQASDGEVGENNGWGDSG